MTGIAIRRLYSFVRIPTRIQFPVDPELLDRQQKAVEQNQRLPHAGNGKAPPKLRLAK